MTEKFQKSKKRAPLTFNERVPQCYKEVEKVLKEVKACKGNLKTVLYSSRLRGAIFKKVYSLAVNVLKYRHLLERIIDDTELLKKETFLRKEFAGILIYELIFGRGLPGESKPVQTIKKYEKDIQEAYEIAKNDANFSLTGLHTLPRYVRVNTLVTSVSNVLEDLIDCGFQQIYFDETISLNEYLDLVKNLQIGSFLIDYHFKDLFVFANDENLSNWRLYQNASIFIQDKSSYIPVHALDPKPGCTVLDACAAPGMKTIHIAAAMENKGEIYAYERDKDRFMTLKNALEFANVKICEADCEDFYLVNANDPKFRSLEYILVDPSCSGSGMVSRMDEVTDTEDSKNKLRLQKLAGFQILLLKHALSFPFVRRVVYSTCSVTEEENEFVVHEVLNKFSHRFKLVSVLPDWPIRGSDNFKFGHLCLRAYPEKSLTNGFFVAMFESLEYDEQNKNICSLYDDFSNPTNRMKNENKQKMDCLEGTNPKQSKSDEYVNSTINEETFDGNYNVNLSQSVDRMDEWNFMITEGNSDENYNAKPNQSVGRIDEYLRSNAEQDDALEHKVKRKKHKKKHQSENHATTVEENLEVANSKQNESENCINSVIKDENFDNGSNIDLNQSVVKVDGYLKNNVEEGDALEHKVKRKKQKKRHQSENHATTVEENLEVANSKQNESENCINSVIKEENFDNGSNIDLNQSVVKVDGYLKNNVEEGDALEHKVKRKKHKKRHHFEIHETIVDENLHHITKISIDLKTTYNEENTLKKKHKKKKHTHENPEVIELINTDLMNDSNDCRVIKKHKKRHYENLEVNESVNSENSECPKTALKKSKYQFDTRHEDDQEIDLASDLHSKKSQCVSTDNNKNSKTFLENQSGSDLQFEETHLKKKHKKKCKYKRNKED